MTTRRSSVHPPSFPRGGGRNPAGLRAAPEGAAFLLALLLVACDGEARDAPDAPATADVSVATPAEDPGSLTQAPARLVDDEVRLACDSAAAPWRTLPGARVQWADTLLRPGDFITDAVADSIISVPATTRYAGCIVDAVHDDPPAHTFERSYWRRAGWPELWWLAADGPGGDVRTYQRGFIRCQVSTEWDPGDDSDPGYVPATYEREIALCWRHSRLVTVRDTARPSY